MLEKVNIKNFLSIINNQELKVSNRITTLIGGNATGKTSILRAIEKLNGEKILPNEKNIKHKNEDTIINAKFKLTISQLEEFNNKHTQKYESPFLLYPLNEDLYYYLELEEDGSLNYYIKTKDNSEIDLINIALPSIIEHFKEVLKDLEHEEIKEKMLQSLSNGDTILDVLNNLTEEEKTLINSDIKKELNKLLDEINNFSDEMLPDYKFIYMNSFKDVLVDNIPIDSISANKTVLNFLDIAGISKEAIKKAVELEDQQEITTIENKTVSVVTEHFKKIFSQVKDDAYFKISMRIDNKNKTLNFWIQNKTTEEAVLPFTAESEGMQWYLSMYLKLYEYFNNTSDNTKYILLLDEPNIYLHGEAQYDLLNNVFKKKMQDVQIIYSTHSPYMIDADDLYSLRIIDKDDETRIFTTTTDYLRSKRKTEKVGDVDVLSPVLIATGISISNQLTVSQDDKIIVVEGPHDYYMLSAMKKVLKINDDKIKFIPCNGATKVPFMCSYLYGLGYKVTAILDNDGDGRKAIETIKYENEDFKFIKALLYEKKINDSEKCVLEDLFSTNDKDKYMPKKSTIAYRSIYDSRSSIEFDAETKENFKHIFSMLKKSFDE